MASAKSPDDYILVVCPTCHTRLHPRWDQAGKRITCPDCGVKLLVPWPARRVAQPKPDLEEIGEYDVQEGIKPPPLETPYLDAQQLVMARGLPAPPRWTFLSGVFSFPWYRGSISRWAYLSLGFLAIGEIGAVGWLLSGIGRIGIVFFGIVLIWLSVWSFSYAASCCLAIVQDTAAGNDEAVSWPGSDWREWVWRMVYAGYLLVLGALVGYGVGWLVARLTDQFWQPMLATTFLVFPVIVLSSLEADSAWVPASAVVLRSLLTFWWGWLVFYAETALLLAGWGCLVYVGTGNVPVLNDLAKAVSRICFGAPVGGGVLPFLTIALAAPLLAAILLIYARLLGRLAWRASVS